MPFSLHSRRAVKAGAAALAGAVAALVVILGGIASADAAETRIAVVAAENFYGDVAQQIGGSRVAVTSILSNPDQDPHLFEVSPAIVRQVAAAQIVIENGADYDSWMDKLIRVTPRSGRVIISVADLVHKKAGDNPHLWYDPATMPVLARALAAALTAADPIHRDEYAARLQDFVASLAPLNNKIAEIRSKYAGVPVAATEPVFGYMAAALRLQMREDRFQLATMNDTEPRVSDLAAFERDLKTRQVRVLFYDRQAADNIVRHLVDLAHAAGIPVVGMTETAPSGMSYQDWMLSELEQTAKVLAGPSS